MLLLYSWTVVPVQYPCWTPITQFLYAVTNAVVPVIAVVVSICVVCAPENEVKKVGSMLGMAEPANCTFTPLNTPLLLLLALALPVVPTVLEARTPSVAEFGPEVILDERLRSNCPAEARSRLARF